MRENEKLRRRAKVMTVFTISFLLIAVACQPARNVISNANANANANTNASLNSNSSVTNSNMNAESTSSATVNARKPEKYSSTLHFSIATDGGHKAIGI